MVVRVPLCTATAPTRAHTRFLASHPQLLVGERDLARLMRARFHEPLPYVNWLTATSYVMLFHQVGLEMLDARRMSGDDTARARERLSQVLPGISPGELASSLVAHLVRPVSLGDLRSAGRFDDTRPRAIREQAMSS